MPLDAQEPEEVTEWHYKLTAELWLTDTEHRLGEVIFALVNRGAAEVETERTGAKRVRPVGTAKRHEP